MEAEDSIVSGQWEGFFQYGFGYENAKEKVKFRLALTHLGDGQFTGKCIELEGPGMAAGLSSINGFVQVSFISFTKEYNTDSHAPTSKNRDKAVLHPKPLLIYTGNYNWNDQSFAGKWEFIINNPEDKFGGLTEAGSGTWKMHRV